MKKQYYIIGSGGFAKEVSFLADELLEESYNFMGFIDYKPEVKTIIVRGQDVSVIDEDYFLGHIIPSEGINLYLGIGDPKLLGKLSKQFENYIFPNLIHPNFIGDRKSIQLERGNIITAGCVFTVDIKIGSHNIFNLNSTVGHDTVIGDCNIFNPGCNISGSVNRLWESIWNKFDCATVY